MYLVFFCIYLWHAVVFLFPVPPSPGSPAELCQLSVDDEIVAVNGVMVAHMNHNQWKDKITHALQKGSLTMDVRRYGNKGKMTDLYPPLEMIWSLTCNITYFVHVLV